MSQLQKDCAAIEQQLRDCQARPRTLTDTLVHSKARAAKSVVYASHLLERVIAEVASLNVGEV